MAYWVWRADGALQCSDVAGQSLDAARADLALLVSDGGIIAGKQMRRQVIAMCGAPSGVMNAFEVTELARHILFHGFVGPMGFADCPKEINVPPLAAVAEADRVADLAAVAGSTGITSATANPVLIRELVGRAVRIYEFGDSVTEDYRPYRTNIVTLDGRVQDIWFG